MSEPGIKDMEDEVRDLDRKLSGILRFKEGKEKRRKTLNKLVSNIERNQNVDFVFLVDITGTMQRHIELVGENCVKISKIVRRAFRGFQMRAAFIGYRDFYAKKDEKEVTEKRFEILPLGPVERLPSFLRGIKTSGGGDIAEDVFGGLECIQNLKFDDEHTTRLLFHLADAPCHGKEYHDLNGPEADYFPGGDPLERDIRDLLGFLVDRSIHYFFVQIRDPITSKFSVRFYRVKNIHDLSTSTAKTFHPEYESVDRYFSFQNPAFATGVFRFAYMAKTKMKGLQVAKIFKKKECWGNHGIEYKREALVQVFGSRFAEEFNCEMERLKINERVRFLPANIIESVSSKTPTQNQFLSIEPFLGAGEFEKYNNNAGAVTPNITDEEILPLPLETPQAFSHYTYERTKGFMILVDIQGCRKEVVEGTSKKKRTMVWYELTDPLCHSEKDMMVYPDSKRRFGLGGNFGKEGVKMFFGTHVCNSICKALKLKERKVRKKKKKK